jgi:hypothetical protein
MGIIEGKRVNFFLTCGSYCYISDFFFKARFFKAYANHLSQLSPTPLPISTECKIVEITALMWTS